jgi:hypothetical protein
MATNGQLVQQITKRLAYGSVRTGLGHASAVSRSLDHVNSYSPDTQERPRAFVEKRRPRFGGDAETGKYPGRRASSARAFNDGAVR